MEKKFEQNGEELNNMPIENQPARDFLYFLWDLLKTGIVVFVIAFAIRYFLIQPFVVEGSSMMPNFIDTEYLLAEKLTYSLYQPNRGDVVIFKYPKNPSVNFIKRVIGLPGETVTIENNTIKIINNDHPNGFMLDESAYLPSGTQTITGEKIYSITLRDKEYFVMGDNREHSSDSREWGVLPKTNIIGRAWLIIKPLDRFGIEHRISYVAN
ncbi:MAG: signal peptidase I [Patescibacteria group bacterium]